MCNKLNLQQVIPYEGTVRLGQNGNVGHKKYRMNSNMLHMVSP